MMKIAISGKSGVDKPLLSSLLAKTFVEAGYSVLATDADPDTNLANRSILDASQQVLTKVRHIYQALASNVQTSGTKTGLTAS